MNELRLPQSPRASSTVIAATSPRSPHSNASQKREEEKEKIKLKLIEEEKAMDEEWNDNGWADDIQVSEQESIMA